MPAPLQSLGHRGGRTTRLLRIAGGPRLRQALLGFAALTLGLLGAASPVSAGLFLPKTDYPTGFGPRGIAIGDVDGDGRIDIVTADYVAGAASVLRANRDLTFGPPLSFEAGDGSRAVAVVDLNGDGQLDLAVANYDHSSVSVMLNSGAGSFGPASDVFTRQGPYAVALGDLNGDGRLDLVVPTLLNGSVEVFLGRGDGSFGPATDFAAGSAPAGVAIGRLNADAYPDLVVANYYSNSVSVLLGNGDGTFGTARNFLMGINPSAVALADLNGDGQLDLAVANFGQNRVSVLRGAGDGTFGSKTDYGTGAGPVGVALADLDGDSRLDLVTANYSANTVSVRLGNGLGGFGAKTDYATGNHPAGIAVGDLNDDGEPDIAVPNYLASSVSVLLHIYPLPRFIRVAPDSLDFGSGYIAYPETLAVVARNLGFDVLQVTGVSTDQPEFTVLDSTSFALASGSQRTLRVRYARSVVGSVTGALSISSDDPVNPTVEVALSGETRAAPAIALSPDSLLLRVDLGGTGQGTLVVTNAGLGTLHWSLTESPAVNWLSESPLSGAVAAGESVEVQVVADAAGLIGGLYTTTLQFSSDDPTRPLRPLSVRFRVVGVPQIVVDPQSLDFGADVSGRPETLSVTARNPGTDVLHVAGPTTDNPDFSVVDGVGFQLTVGAQRSVRVRYNRTAHGLVSGTLSIQSDDPAAPTVLVALAGQALYPPSLTVTPDSVVFALASGDSGTAGMTIGNTGEVLLTYELKVESAGTSPSTAERKPPPSPPPAWSSAPLPDSTSWPPRSERPAPQPLRLAPIAGVLTEPRAILFQDRWPWNTPANNQVLDANGISWDLLGSGSLASIDLTAYRLVIVASDQFQVTYDALRANFSKFVNYVAGGGVLEFHAAGWGANGGNPSGIVLPGGVHIANRFDANNTVVDPGHPTMVGVPNPVTGTYASNAYLSGLPPDAHVIALDGAGNPTLAEYRYGSGIVIVSGQTLEYGYAYGQASGQILRNLIPYSFAGRLSTWLSVAPSSGQVAGGGQSVATLTAHSAGLLGGTYRMQLRILANDPQRASVAIPLRLDVSGVPNITVQPVAVDFGSRFVGVPESTAVTVRNAGTQLLTVSAIAADSPEFRVSGATSFTLSPYFSRDVMVRYERTTVGSFTVTLTIESDDPDTPEARVTLSGTATEPPVMEVGPDSVVLAAQAGETTVGQLTVRNRGLGVLAWSIAQVPSVGWLTELPLGGTVAPEDSQEVEVRADAGALVGGVYTTTLQIRGDDPARPSRDVGARLVVVGIPDINVSPLTLDFGPKFLGLPETLLVTVTNAGTEVLHVSGAPITGDEFSALDPAPFQIAAHGQRNVRVRFARVALGPATGSLTLASDDPDSPTLQVGLAGEATPPPVAVVTPDSIVFALSNSDSGTVALTIANAGEPTMDFKARVEPIRLSPAPTTAYPAPIPVPGPSSAPAPDSTAPPGPDTTAALGPGSAPPGHGAHPVPLLGRDATSSTNRKVLLFQDRWPWNTPANNQVLDANAIPWDLLGSGDLPSTEFTPYSAVIVASDQFQVTYDALLANLAKFVNYVAGGGLLEFHGAGWGSNGGDPSAIVLPGGVHIHNRFDDFNAVLDPSHPLMAGVPNPFAGTHASHAYFTGLPATAHVVAVDQTGNVTLAEYGYGLGIVIMSGQTLEYGQANGQAAGQILRNLIPYSYVLSLSSWLSVSPTGGEVPGGGQVVGEVKARSTGLSGGTYRSQIRVTTNDPQRPAIVVPVQLDVVVPTPVQVSVATVEATVDGVRLSWYLADHAVSELNVFRSESDNGWAPIGTARRGGDGLVPFEDRAVTPGGRYGYRVGLTGETADQASGEVWVDIPNATLALRPLSNPFADGIAFEVSLANREPASLELLDVTGHRVDRVGLDASEIRQHTVRIGERARPAPGIYWARLRQGGRVVVRRVAVVR